jgi:predicted glycoside hydrolase/deacetylase ChbG (UPF0249 family)
MTIVVQLLVVADDLGICAERDRGIFECLHSGLVTAAVILPNGETAAAAAAQARALGLADKVGLHWNVSEGRPVSDPSEVGTLLVPDGGADGEAVGMPQAEASRKLGSSRHPQLRQQGQPPPPPASAFMGMRELKQCFDAGKVDPQQLAHELQAQLSWFRDHLGRFPTFVNGHQHCHISLFCEPVARVLKACGVRYLRHTSEVSCRSDGTVCSDAALQGHTGASAPTVAAADYDDLEDDDDCKVVVLPPLCERCAWVATNSEAVMAQYKVRGSDGGCPL